MYDADAREERWGSERPPVDVQGSAVTQHDVSRAPFHGDVDRKASGDLASVPPDRVSAPGVIVVGPDEELKPLPRELESGAQVIHRPMPHLRITQYLRVDSQLHDHRLALKPSPMKAF
jgi:hypothetical protein